MLGWFGWFINPEFKGRGEAWLSSNRKKFNCRSSSGGTVIQLPLPCSCTRKISASWLWKSQLDRGGTVLQLCEKRIEPKSLAAVQWALIERAQDCKHSNWQCRIVQECIPNSSGIPEVSWKIYSAISWRVRFRGSGGAPNKLLWFCARRNRKRIVQFEVLSFRPSTSFSLCYSG